MPALLPERICRCATGSNISLLKLNSLIITLCSLVQADNLKQVAGGVLAANTFGGLTTDDKKNAISRIASFMAADGSFKMSPEDEVGTAANAHFALEILAAVAGDSTSGSDLAVDVFEKAFQMLPGGEYEGEPDVTLMVPLSKLTDKKLRLVGDRLNVVAESLLNKRHSSCMTSVSRVYDSLQLVAQYKASPVHVSFAQNRFDANPQTHKLQVVAKSILGEDLPLEAVEVVAVKTIGKDSAHFAGEKFENDVLDMSSASLGPGRYLAQVTVTVAGRPKSLPHQAYFAVADAVTIRDVRFQLVGGSDDATSTEPEAIKAQNSLQAGTASAMAGDSVRVTFQVASKHDGAATRKPHQAVVRFTHRDSGRSAVFIAKRSGDSTSALHYEVKFSVADSMARFDHLSGAYVVTVEVGDAAYAAPVEWVLGTVTIALPAKKSEHLPLYAKSLLHTSDVTLQALPEITHVMRPPAKRASNFMATVFTALTAAPLLVFVGFVLSLRPNLFRLGSLPCVAALVCLALMLGLYVSYWLALPGVSFYETIRFLCILTPITVVVGSFALSSVKAMRLKVIEAGKDKLA